MKDAPGPPKAPIRTPSARAIAAREARREASGRPTPRRGAQAGSEVIAEMNGRLRTLAATPILPIPPEPPTQALARRREPLNLPPRQSATELIQDRLNAYAQILDDAMYGLQVAADEAERAGDMVAVVAIKARLADMAARWVTSPAALAAKPEGEMVDLAQFTPETRRKLLDAFAAASAERRATQEREEVERAQRHATNGVLAGA